MTKEKVLNTLAIVGIFVIAITLWAFWIWMAFFVDYGEAQSAAKPKQDVVLEVKVLESEQEIRVTDEEVVLLGPARYKIVRAAYKDNCWYNHTNSYIYGSGEDVMTVNTASDDIYEIYCQPLIGRGDIVIKIIRVVVLEGDSY